MMNAAGLIANDVVPNSSDGRGGTADDATLIFANTHTDVSGNCELYGADSSISALNWARIYGATVVSFSGLFTRSQGQLQGSGEILFDYFARTYGMTMVYCNGNCGSQAQTTEAHGRLRNGFGVGQADDIFASDRSEVTESTEVCWTNPANGAHWELPHLLAPGRALATAGFEDGVVGGFGGCSAAVPQVAGAAASLMEQNAALKTHPDVLFAGLMASADENPDAASGGVYPLSLLDSFDDHDGAGLLNMFMAAFVLDPSARHEGGEPSYRGHDYGDIYSSTTPAGRYYGEDWKAVVGSGAILKVASRLASSPDCDLQEPYNQGCTGNPYPDHCLTIWDPYGNLASFACDVDQNNSYASVVNQHGSSWEYTVRIYIVDWHGLTSAPFGIAWNVVGQ